jgi:hypothetical protein
LAFQQSKRCLFEKKQQKTFVFPEASATHESNPRPGAKVFWFFFSKKNLFPYFPTPSDDSLFIPAYQLATCTP